MEKSRFCIVHYDGKEQYSKLKDVSEQNESRIREAKAKRETFSDENCHEKQCHLVPDIIDNDIYGIHMEPCYKKFTLILAKKSIEQTIRRSSKRTSMDVTKNVEATSLFPLKCYFCKKIRVQHKGKKINLVQIITHDASETIKAAAKAKDNEMYLELKDLCLIVKELRYHDHCYINFTRGFSKAERNKEEDQEKVKALVKYTSVLYQIYYINFL